VGRGPIREVIHVKVGGGRNRTDNRLVDVVRHNPSRFDLGAVAAFGGLSLLLLLPPLCLLQPSPIRG